MLRRHERGSPSLVAAASPLASAALPETPLFDMTTVVSQLIGLGIGLAGGLITGFYFERRAVRQNAELLRQISVLKTTMYSLGAPAEVVNEEPTLAEDLASLVTAHARQTQDASGRVHRPDLIAHFVARGDDPRDIEAVISSMSAVGAAKEEGEWLRLP